MLTLLVFFCFLPVSFPSTPPCVRLHYLFSSSGKYSAWEMIQWLQVLIPRRTACLRSETVLNLQKLQGHNTHTHTQTDLLYLLSLSLSLKATHTHTVNTQISLSLILLTAGHFFTHFLPTSTSKLIFVKYKISLNPWFSCKCLPARCRSSLKAPAVSDCCSLKTNLIHNNQRKGISFIKEKTLMFWIIYCCL